MSILPTAPAHFSVIPSPRLALGRDGCSLCAEFKRGLKHSGFKISLSIYLSIYLSIIYLCNLSMYLILETGSSSVAQAGGQWPDHGSLKP